MEKFKDRTKVKERKSSFEFAAPSKEMATTGRFMHIGDSYGVGVKQPVGRLKNTDQKDVIPQTSHSFCPCAFVK